MRPLFKYAKVLFLVLLAALAAAAAAEDTVRVVVVAPKMLYTDTAATVSVTAVTPEQAPVVAAVKLQLVGGAAGAQEVFAGATDIMGRLSAEFDVPPIEPGAYTLEITVDGAGGPLTAPVEVRAMPVVLIETDKPIYKPGQTIQGRVLVLSNRLRPQRADLSVEITDGKGVKVFRKELVSNAFGVAPFELPLASELNYGTWKITAESGSSSGFVDVRVEKYVLPRFSVELGMEKDYFLVDETVTGSVNAAYFFGKPVDGTVRVTASRYVGIWEEYAQYSAVLSEGTAAFELPAVGYVAGTPGGGGAGSVQLEVVVTDTSGHEEKTTKLLRIVRSSLSHQLISLSRVIVPGSRFDVMLTAETQEGDPATAAAEVVCEYQDANWRKIAEEKHTVSPFTTSRIVSFKAPEGAAMALIRSTARTEDGITAEASLTVYAAYSPTDSFLQLRRDSDKPVNVGDLVTVEVFKTHEATVYYDVFANGRTLWSGATVGTQIVFRATEQMLPSARVVAYVINPNNEVSADSLDFDVHADDLAGLDVQFSSGQVLPGEPVKVLLKADAQAMVGLTVVDESVYALNEGRLNMQAVFDELERLFMEPQSETHEQAWNNGACGVFEDAHLQIITSEGVSVPQGRNIWKWDWWWRGDWEDALWLAPAMDVNGAGGGGLAEVTRIRQFFPETWLWTPDLLTDPDGNASIDLTAPDSITTWRLHAVSTSNAGLGVGESKLVVFQEFFGEPDLPYAVTRGEQFPIRIQVFNYLDVPQVVYVELADADWFDLLDDKAQQEVDLPANSVGLASFLIQPTRLGRNTLDVTMRSKLRADAVRKELLVEPEGTRREIVTNGAIKAGEEVRLDAGVPPYSVEGSQKVLLCVTPSLVAQSINGLEDLLHMPYGCGEQNMIFFAPDVEVLRYLDATGQLTPEIRAKAESFINAGYQRELTYRRADGSFSAFGESDASGSLWLTAFVLDVFSGARDVQAIDARVLSEACAWIESHQLTDGSWEPIGFLHHQEMIGGMAGKYALTAFVAVALADYGDGSTAVLDRATAYLVDNLTGVQDDAYALAVAALALVRADNPAVETVLERLLALAVRDAQGIHWEPHAVETTAYVALAMIAREMPQANEAVKWLSLQQNAQGGFGQTQETVMALKALMTAARTQSRNVNLTLTARAADADGAILASFVVDGSNFDVLQIAEIAACPEIILSAAGSGQTRFQLVRRFNALLADERIEKDMSLEVVYDADHVEVDDIVNVGVTVRYLGASQSSGMMIVDVGVPTGFAVVQESLDALVEAGTASRVEVAGRKVIFYIDGLSAGETRSFAFQVKARFPVRAVIPDSAAYLYYEPDVRAEDQGRQITVKSASSGDGCTMADLRALADLWLLLVEPGLAADLNTDGVVDLRDFAALAECWLQTPAGQ